MKDDILSTITELDIKFNDIHIKIETICEKLDKLIEHDIKITHILTHLSELDDSNKQCLLELHILEQKVINMVNIANIIGFTIMLLLTLLSIYHME